MADKKISQLATASTPLAGTEVVPVVQSGSTVKVPVSDLTAGRAVSAASYTASTGDVIIGTAGKGIDFSANAHAAGKTSELLDWYEEGTWTPSPTAPSGSFSSVTASGTYTRIGNIVRAGFKVTLTNVGTATAMNFIGGLPFTSSSTNFASTGFRERVNTGVAWTGTVSESVATINTFNYLNSQTVANGAEFVGSIVYEV